MTQWAQTIIDYLSQNPGMAWFAAFFVAMGEALFVIGLVVPSTAVLVGIGALVGLGKLSFWPVFVMTIAGAIVGDALSFWFGHVYKDRVKSMWPFSRYPDAIERGVVFMKRHGGKSIFIGRFVPGVKAVVPGLAGMMGMDVWHFTWINIVSGVAWAAAHLLPAMFAGAAMSFLGMISTRLVIFASFVIVAGLFAGFVVKWTLLYVSPTIARSRLALVQWAIRQRHPAIKWFGRTFDPAHANPTTMLMAALLLAVGVPGFLFILGELGANEPLVLADHALSNLLQGLRTNAVDQTLMTITMLGDGVVLTPVVISALIWLMHKKDLHHALGLAGAAVSTSLFVSLVKHALQRQRPTELYEGLSNLSFPSGHATNNAVVYAILAYLIAHTLPRWQQSLVYVMSTLLILAIGFSRIYLGAHWPSDVAAGLFFGFAMAAAFTLFLGDGMKDAGGPKLAGVTIAALLIFGSFHVASNWQAAQTVYAKKTVIETMVASNWMSDGWQKLPATRIDLIGQMEEPFVLQVAGDPQSVANRLTQQGWTRQGDFKLAKISAFTTSARSIATLPVLPVLHDGREPLQSFVRALPNDDTRRLVLRLWSSDVRISDNGKDEPLFLGSIVEERQSNPLGAFATVDAVDSYVPGADVIPTVSTDQKMLTRRMAPGSASTETPVALAKVAGP